MTDPNTDQALAELSTMYSAELKLLVRLIVANAPTDEIARARASLTALSHQWSAVQWRSITELLHGSRTSEVNLRRYTFVRDNASYECTCDPWAVDHTPWTIRRESCEVDGPLFNGLEFLNAEQTAAFEAQAVQAVRSCTKACALAG